MSTLTHREAGCSQPAACVERPGYEYPDTRLVKRVAPNPPPASKGQGMSTLTHREAGCSQPAVVAEKGQGMSTLTHRGAILPPLGWEY
ncbi:MAG: hypothetical protein LCH91_16900 [Bacteroidetes bacterium]|nr:hypothetical protein [Bacteroidota bacterium]